MVGDKDSQLKNLETEKIIERKAPGDQAVEEKKIEGAVLHPERVERVEIQPVERRKISDGPERFKNGQSGGLAGVSDSGQELKEREKKIGKVLEAGLENIYLSLPAEKQREFRKEGEETMKKINTLLDKAKINLGKIVNLIRRWLSIIPGVNKFFLEQETKIKADEILKLKER